MVIEKIRALALLGAIFIVGYGGYVFLTNFQATTEGIDIEFNDDGVDVKIKNFKIVHDKSGRKDWELKAELAKINQNKKTTAMDKVEIIFFKDEMKKIKVYADFGTLMNKTNDLSLEGNVKMLIQEDVLKKHTSNAPVAKNSKLSIR
jgi:LPS export ABC transporter protein LptC